MGVGKVGFAPLFVFFAGTLTMCSGVVEHEATSRGSAGTSGALDAGSGGELSSSADSGEGGDAGAAASAGSGGAAGAPTLADAGAGGEPNTESGWWWPGPQPTKPCQPPALRRIPSPDYRVLDAFISSDGCVVLASAAAFGPEGMPRGSWIYRYTAEGDWHRVSPDHEQASIVGVSADAQVMVGVITTYGQPRRGYVWSSVVGLQSGELPGEPSALSGDGTVIVGSAAQGLYLLKGGVTTWLDVPSNPADSSAPYLPVKPVTNQNGSVVYWSGRLGVVPNRSFQLFRWTAASGSVAVPAAGFPLSVSADGNTLLLNALTFSDAPRVVRWHAGNTLTPDPLGTSSDYPVSFISADVSVAVGRKPLSREPFFNRRLADGTVTTTLFTDAAAAANIQLADLDIEGLDYPNAISSDGKLVLGNAASTDLWLANLTLLAP